MQTHPHLGLDALPSATLGPAVPLVDPTRPWTARYPVLAWSAMVGAGAVLVALLVRAARQIRPPAAGV